MCSNRRNVNDGGKGGICSYLILEPRKKSTRDSGYELNDPAKRTTLWSIKGSNKQLTGASYVVVYGEVVL